MRDPVLCIAIPCTLPIWEFGSGGSICQNKGFFSLARCPNHSSACLHFSVHPLACSICTTFLHLLSPFCSLSDTLKPQEPPLLAPCLVSVHRLLNQSPLRSFFKPVNRQASGPCILLHVKLHVRFPRYVTFLAVTEMWATYLSRACWASARSEHLQVDPSPDRTREHPVARGEKIAPSAHSGVRSRIRPACLRDETRCSGRVY